jgi:hypothetical protein
MNKSVTPRKALAAGIAKILKRLHYPLEALSRCWHVAGNAATIAGMKRTDLQQSVPGNDAISYTGYRFPPDVISYAVWLYYRFPLSLRMVEELLAARGMNSLTRLCGAGQ